MLSVKCDIRIGTYSTGSLARQAIRRRQRRGAMPPPQTRSCNWSAMCPNAAVAYSTVQLTTGEYVARPACADCDRTVLTQKN